MGLRRSVAVEPPLCANIFVWLCFCRHGVKEVAACCQVLIAIHEAEELTVGGRHPRQVCSCWGLSCLLVRVRVLFGVPQCHKGHYEGSTQATVLFLRKGGCWGRSGSHPFRFPGSGLSSAPVVAIWATCILLTAFGLGFRVEGPFYFMGLQQYGPTCTPSTSFCLSNKNPGLGSRLSFCLHMPTWRILEIL